MPDVDYFAFFWLLLADADLNCFCCASA